MASIGSFTVDFKATIDGLLAPVKQAQSAVSELNTHVDKVREGLETFAVTTAAVGASLVAAATAVAGPMLAMVKSVADLGDSLNDMAQRTGVSVEQLSVLKFAAEQSGATIEDVGAGLRVLAKNMSEHADKFQ